ncbi:MAG: thioredoxin family protein [Chitinophagaceae bacterium]
MKKLFLIAILFVSFSATAQTTALQQALAAAKTEHKQVLLTFSGSDWCIPCIRMEKEIFEKEEFQQYAKDHLLRVQADFPRMKKHQLSAELKKENEALAETYNPKGIFPLTVLLDAEGHVVKAWEGMAAASSRQFIQQIEATHHVN